MEAVISVKVVDMAQVAKGLSPEEQDVLMKYLYAGMAAPEQYNSGHLLSFHEKVKEGNTSDDRL
jgi:actin related protein 2/3 complex subunit 5